MTARSAVSSGSVDTAAIAAAVAAELDIPTAAENATAVGAQAACAAAITAAGIPAATATAVGAQAAAAAAIDAKLGDIGAAVALAVPDSADIQAAAAAGLSAAWGTVLQVKAQYFGATIGNLTGVLIVAPGAKLRIEILYWGVTTFATAGAFSWSSGATTNLDTGPDVQTRFLGKGPQISETAISPTKPLYTLAENANFGITLDVDAEIVVDIKYRIVSTS
jgi:hypothetical protein